MRITVLDMGKHTDWFWWYRIQLFDHGDSGTMNRGWYLILEPTHVGGMTIAYIPWFDHGTYYYGKKNTDFLLLTFYNQFCCLNHHICPHHCIINQPLNKDIAFGETPIFISSVLPNSHTNFDWSHHQYCCILWTAHEIRHAFCYMIYMALSQNNGNGKPQFDG